MRARPGVGGVRDERRLRGAPAAPRRARSLLAPTTLPAHPLPTRCSPALNPPRAARWYEREGERLYQGLVEGFRGVQYGGPPPCPPGGMRWRLGSVLHAYGGGRSLLRSLPRTVPSSAAQYAQHRHPSLACPATLRLSSYPSHPAGASDAQLLAGVQRLLDIYVDRGYALKASLAPGSSGGGGGRATLSPLGAGAAAAAVDFEVKLEGPANLWSLQVGAAQGGQGAPLRVQRRPRAAGCSGLPCQTACLAGRPTPSPCRPPPSQALAARRSSLYNDHCAAAIAAFLRASGRGSACRLAWSDTGVAQRWTLV